MGTCGESSTCTMDRVLKAERQAMDAEWRVLKAEQRALEAERRAAEAERRALEAEAEVARLKETAQVEKDKMLLYFKKERDAYCRITALYEREMRPNKEREALMEANLKLVQRAMAAEERLRKAQA